MTSAIRLWNSSDLESSKNLAINTKAKKLG
jgi:hypothetical protein